jgi:coenzyme Q-binding protein COQ10
MAQAETTEIFDISAEKFYQAVTDYQSYPQFVDGVSAIKIVEENAKGAIVEFSVNLLKKFSYKLKLKHQKNKKVSWRLEESDLFSTNNGEWILQPQKDGGTKVTYKLKVEFRGFVPDMIIKKLVSSNLPSTMQAFYQRAKKTK